MKTSFAYFSLLCVAPCLAGEYLSVVTTDDLRTVTITTAYGSVLAPRTLPDQEGFDTVLISPDGARVGWLALTANCCTSYPLPTALVIVQHGKVIRTFAESSPIFDWRFARRGQAVIYRQSWPHGLVPTIYKLRRISDGKTLAVLTCYPAGLLKESTGPIYDPAGKLPRWLEPIREVRSPEQAVLAATEGHCP